jgi:uncharacterized cupredoxin-like copper-binding protein
VLRSVRALHPAAHCLYWIAIRHSLGETHADIHNLTDEQWSLIEPCLPATREHPLGGRPYRENRDVLNALPLAPAHALPLALALALVLSTAACGQRGGAGTAAGVPAAGEHTHTDDGHTHADDGHTHYSFGEPGDPAASTRTIEIEATDTMRFEPDLVEVDLGETVTLRISNTGVITHDVLLGTLEEQEAHETEMQHDPSMAHGPSGVLIPPGETRDLVWHFSSAGEVLFGCHVPGHYPSGMVGTVVVRER